MKGIRIKNGFILTIMMKYKENEIQKNIKMIGKEDEKTKYFN